MGKTCLGIPAKYVNRAYRPFVDAPERLQLYYGGAGSGKSAFVATRVALDALVGRNTLVVRQVAARIGCSCHNEIRKAIARMGAERLYRVREDAITAVQGGAQILFSGLDDSEKIKSVTPRRGALTDIWIEEATEVGWDSFRQLDKRLRGQSPFAKRLTMTFNPVHRGHWLYRTYFEGQQVHTPLTRRDGLLMLHTTYRDNAFLAAEDGLALEAERDSYHYQVYTLGQWGRTSQAVLTNWRVESLRGRAFPPASIRCGLDFGFSIDPAACVRLSYDKAGKRIYVIGEMLETGLTNDRLAERVRPLARGAWLMCDSAEPKSIAELRRAGLPAMAARKGPDSLAHSLQWLRQHEIIVDEACARTARELEGYAYAKTPSGELTSRPKAGDDHLIDALRYALSADMDGRYGVTVG